MNIRILICHTKGFVRQRGQLGNSGGVINAVKENVKNIKNQNQVIKNSYELYDTGKAVNDFIKVENK